MSHRSRREFTALQRRSAEPDLHSREIGRKGNAVVPQQMRETRGPRRISAAHDAQEPQPVGRGLTSAGSHSFDLDSGGAGWEPTIRESRMQSATIERPLRHRIGARPERPVNARSRRLRGTRTISFRWQLLRGRLTGEASSCTAGRLASGLRRGNSLRRAAARRRAEEARHREHGQEQIPQHVSPLRSNCNEPTRDCIGRRGGPTEQSRSSLSESYTSVRRLRDGFGISSSRLHLSGITLSRRALAMTETELRLIAAAASIGLSSSPKFGYRTPAAIGTPTTL